MLQQDSWIAKKKIAHAQLQYTSKLRPKQACKKKKKRTQVISPPPLPPLPHRGSAVQRGRLVKSVSLVPSQDEVLPALSPSAPIPTAVLPHTRREGEVRQRTHHPATRTRALPALMTVAWTITPTTLTFVPRLMGQMTVGSRSSPWGRRCSSGCGAWGKKERKKKRSWEGKEK